VPFVMVEVAVSSARLFMFFFPPKVFFACPPFLMDVKAVAGNLELECPVEPREPAHLS